MGRVVAIVTGPASDDGPKWLLEFRSQVRARDERVPFGQPPGTLG